MSVPSLIKVCGFIDPQRMDGLFAVRKQVKDPATMPGPPFDSIHRSTDADIDRQTPISKKNLMCRTMSQ